ncbi:MAG: DUF2953 domain-containing protein [Clostridia bacterium]|nr:DUF2953 domain-containing protein [Clostridia bacterium]
MYKIMLILIILFVSFALIFFLLPVNLILKYDKKIECILRFGFLKINLNKFENKLKINDNSNNTQKKIKKSKINIKKSLKLAKLFKNIFVQIIRKIKIKELNFVLNIGQEDAYYTAVRYGQACAVVYPLFRFIILKKKIKKYKISVNPNFNIFKTKFCFKINLRSNLLSMIVIILKIFGGNL